MNYKLKNFIKHVLSKNSYTNAMFYHRLGKSNREKLQTMIANMRSMDFLEDISYLQDFRKNIDQQQAIFSTTDANWSNGHIYGIWQAIYGDYQQDTVFCYPAIEHGLIFHEDVFTDLRGTGRVCLSTFSNFRKQIIQQKLHRPVFCVGPYIHYCKYFYSEKKLKELKEKFGKTLLVFPTHSTDTSKLSVNQQHYLQELRSIAKNYDTVLVNVFWWNVNDALTKALQKEGYRVISCGFRDDPMFLRRLKSYIHLADFAIGDSIGTHVGYCVSEGVPFSYREMGTGVALLKEEEKRDFLFRDYHIGRIQQAFLNAEAINDQQWEIVKEYWGFDYIKTSEEIQLIKEISLEILHKTKGFTSQSYRVALQLLKEYERSQPHKYSLLKEALPLL